MNTANDFRKTSTYACSLILIAPLLGAANGTSANFYVSGTHWPLSQKTDNSLQIGVLGSAHLQSESASDAILGIRRLANLTWDEVAQIFDVSRRTAHHWANGRPPAAEQERRISRLYGLLKTTKDIEPSEVRELLMSNASPGRLYFDLLRGDQMGDFQSALSEFKNKSLPKWTPSVSSAIAQSNANSTALAYIEALHDSPPAESKAMLSKAIRIPRRST